MKGEFIQRRKYRLGTKQEVSEIQSARRERERRSRFK